MIAWTTRIDQRMDVWTSARIGLTDFGEPSAPLHRLRWSALSEADRGRLRSIAEGGGVVDDPGTAALLHDVAATSLRNLYSTGSPSSSCWVVCPSS